MTNQEATDYLINKSYVEDEVAANSLISNINTNSYESTMGISEDLYNLIKS